MNEGIASILSGECKARSKGFPFVPGKYLILENDLGCKLRIFVIRNNNTAMLKMAVFIFERILIILQESNSKAPALWLPLPHPTG